MQIRLDSSVCNNKHRWKKNKCKCEYKELIDKGISDKKFIWNPSNCNCECDKLCGIAEYLDDRNCKCRKMIVGGSVEECSNNINENEMIHNETLHETPLNDYKKVCSSCTLYIVLFVIFLIIT